jgi:flagellar assembly protein FliH
VRATPQQPQRVVADKLPTADEVASIEQQAREEGLRAGLAEARAGNERTAALLAGVPVAVARMEREIADAVVKLAVDLARQIVRESLTVKPELIVPVVSEAISGIARSAEPGGIHVHPDDLAILQERLGDALAHGNWKAFGDERVQRGGCRIEFTGGQVDASIATRWQRVMAQLDRQDDWLD